MAINTIDTAADRPLAEEIFRLQRLDKETGPKNGAENASIEASLSGKDTGEGLALAPLVDKIAYGIARGLVVAMKELENHIASETRKVGDSVTRRLDTLQASVQDLTVAVSEQRAFSISIQDQCKELAAGAVSLAETDARQDVELESLRTAAKETSSAMSARIDALCKDLGVQQEDIAAVKSTLCGFSSTVEGLVERLDRQADALRTMCAAYAQRETELGSLVDGLARLRAYPAPTPTDRL